MAPRIIYTPQKVKEMAAEIMRGLGDRYQGYTIINCVNTDNVMLRCASGHEWKTRLPMLRLGKRCGQCHGAIKYLEETIADNIQRTWANDARFTGYSVVRIFFNGRWTYTYRCAADHERTVILTSLPGQKLFPCSHIEHPKYQTKPQSEYRQALLDHWKADPRMWQGYKLVKLGQYTKVDTEITCPKMHMSKVAPYRILKYNAGCTHRDCIALRIFQSGTNYKHLIYAGKRYKYQGYEDRLLRILFKRFVSDCIDTNAMLVKPISFHYEFDRAIHHYFPDIRVRTPTYRRWYEVKSRFTYDCNGLDDDLRAQNHAKWKSASQKTGEMFDAFIWGHSESDLKIIRYKPDGSFPPTKQWTDANCNVHENAEAVKYVVHADFELYAQANGEHAVPDRLFGKCVMQYCNVTRVQKRINNVPLPIQIQMPPNATIVAFYQGIELKQLLYRFLLDVKQYQ